ncbi:MAG TPA: tetratricopeptide repeat protein [Thiobacillaceae bacterium]|nr:tetratricopeptide repeat protein [Thiobacillaceae bacterium]
MKPILLLAAAALAALMGVTQALALSDVNQGVVNNQKISSAEYAAMDPVCRLILVDKPFAHGFNQQKENVELLSRPEYLMAKDAGYIHHRCWAIIAKHRYFAERDKAKRDENRASFYGDMNYVLQNAPKDWRFLPQIHTEIGQFALYEQDYRKAILSANNAINQDRTYADAYVLLADTYQAMNDKEKAKKTIQDGLAADPTSRALARRAAKYGIKVPEPPPAPAKPAPTQPAPVKAQGPAEQGAPEKPPVQDAAVVPTPPSTPAPVPATPAPAPPPTPQAPPQTAPETPASGATAFPPVEASPAPDAEKKPNPYCRFCP